MKKKKQTKRILRTVFIVASITSLVFVPWILVRAWLAPLSDAVQEQVNDAIGYGLGGKIVYLDQNGKPPFAAAGRLLQLVHCFTPSFPP